MNPANYREALIETAADEAEGADILLVMILLCILQWLAMKMECLCVGLKPWSSFDRSNQDYHTWMSSDFFGIIQRCRLLLTRLVHYVTKSIVQLSLLFQQKVQVPCLVSTCGANAICLFNCLLHRHSTTYKNAVFPFAGHLSG
jgi:hypothetical protein